MARIRTVKPDYLRHELLQELELKHPTSYPMIVFIGLWTQADKNGVFPFKPRTLKLDILPFLPFDMENTLTLLEKNGFIKRFISEKEIFGFIPTFKDHQRITGKEAMDSAKYPMPTKVIKVSKGKQKGNNGEALGQQQGAQEGNGVTGTELQEQEGKGSFGASAEPDPITPPKPPPPKKEKGSAQKEKEVTAHWQALVDEWFRFYGQHHKGVKPSFKDKNPAHLKSIMEQIKARFEDNPDTSHMEWNQINAVESLRVFLQAAWSDNWLKSRFLLSNLNSMFDAIASPNGNQQSNSKNRTAADQTDYERELAGRIGVAPNQSGFPPI